jgi:Glycogen recognition site of AMP-activated protein kinase
VSAARGDAAASRRRDPVSDLGTLRDVDPPGALVARVMTRLSEPPPPTFWQWLLMPLRFELRLSPLGAVALGLGLVVGVALFAAPHPSGGPVSMLEVKAADDGAAGGSAHDGPVIVRFTLEARGAKHVAVAGSFNGWSTDALRLDDVNQDGVFAATVALPPGLHEYMFVVDGEWVPDPAASERRPDGFGRQNSLLRL